MSELLGSRSVRALLATHGIRPRKELGQNFVIDPNTIRKVIDVSGVGPDDTVLEIGAGVGSLTLGLASVARNVIALETDPGLIAVLGESLAGVDNVEVLHADVTKDDLGSHLANVVVANLPYNIAALVTLRVLEEAPGVRELTVMVQREVGERLAAPPGSRAYGAISALAAYWASVSVAARVGRGSFFPAPDVESVLLRITRRDPPTAAYDGYREVVRAAFAQRRKTLRNSLTAVFGSTLETERVLLSAGVDPRERAERLGVAAFAKLASVPGG